MKYQIIINRPFKFFIGKFKPLILKTKHHTSLTIDSIKEVYSKKYKLNEYYIDVIEIN